MRQADTNMEYLPGFEQKGSGVPVLLLHGFCGSRRYWYDMLPVLSAKYHVIVPDLRGHGTSPASEGVYTMDKLADDTAAIMDRLNIDKAFVFGHSLSGYSTLAFAEKYPHRLLGFGLIHSTSLPDTEAGRQGRQKAVDTLKSEGVKPFVDGLIPKLFAPEHRTAMENKVTAAKEIGYVTSPQGAIGCALGMKDRPDRTDVLRNTNLPVLLLAGENDEVIPADRRFPVTGPNISQVTLPGVGHMSMMEDPASCADEIADFIEKSRGNGIV
jgi:3-oxoadipate enol-lactonase